MSNLPTADDSESVIITVTVDDDNQSALFGKYEMGKQLGAGAFAKVYQATDVRGGDNVAIKVVDKKRLREGLTAHIKREISVMRRLRHPHIVRLFEVLATKTKIYFIMELAKGGELLSSNSRSRYSENLSRKYFQQLISAVRYSHIRCVFHRDLKPENLLLDDNRNLKVSDFGLSAMRDQIKSDGMLHTLCGTPAYVAPEILAKKGYDGAKADIWSCGVVLFVLNAGYLPFSDSNRAALYRKIYRGDFKMPNWTSSDLNRLISRILDPNPVTRITVDEIIQDPWFRQGEDFNDVMRFQTDDYDLEENAKRMNAFDIISSSSGLNLTGLFGNLITPDVSEQFVSDETPEEILAKVEEVAKGLNMTIAKKKERGMKLEGPKGLYNVMVRLHRLTNELVVVEIKNKQRDAGLMWADALRQKLRALISQPVYRVPGKP